MRATAAPEDRKLPKDEHRATLYIDNMEVTTKCDEQIQYALYAKPMFAYLLERYEWVDAQLSSINWRAIGLAKSRLSKDQSIRATKIMHNWLNVGHQKVKITRNPEAGTCPCYGSAHETQEHLYQCSHAEMKENVHESIEQMEKVFLAENMPSGVTVAFTKLVRKAAGIAEGLAECQCREANKAAELQAVLGPGAILRGHHHVSWVTAIMNTHRKRTHTPGTDEFKRKKDKSALELSAVLVRECWNLFENVWAMRNDPLRRQYRCQNGEQASH